MLRSITYLTRRSPLLFKKCPSTASSVLVRNFAIVCKEDIRKNKKSALIKPESTQNLIQKDAGLSRFVSRVYATTGLGLGATLGGSCILAANPEFMMMSAGPLVLGGFFTSIAGCLGLHFAKYEISEDQTESTNSPARIASYSAIVGGMTASTAPLWTIFHTIDPMIMPISLGLTATTMGAATFWAHRQPPGKLLSWEQPLMGGLFSLVGVGLVGLGSQLVFGPNALSLVLHNVDTYGGIVLFTAFTSYETHAAVKMYQDGDPDHLGCSINVYLDFMNLLIRFAEIVARIKSND